MRRHKLLRDRDRKCPRLHWKGVFFCWLGGAHDIIPVKVVQGVKHHLDLRADILSFRYGITFEASKDVTYDLVYQLELVLVVAAGSMERGSTTQIDM